MSTNGQTHPQDSIENPLIEQLNQLDAPADTHALVKQLIEELEAAREEAEDAYTLASMMMDRNKALREEITELEVAYQEQQETIQTLTTRVNTVESGISKLSDFAANTSSIVEKRALSLLDNLYDEALTDKQKNNEKVQPTAMADWDKAQTILPGKLSREQLYAAMERAEEIVIEEHAVSFIRERKTAEKNTRLQVDLSECDTITTEKGVEFTQKDANSLQQGGL